jgi:hypothetical protein
MITDIQIPEPYLFNPLKHHLGYIRDFINLINDSRELSRQFPIIVRELKHLGTSVTDVYTGSLSVYNICREIDELISREWSRPFPAKSGPAQKSPLLIITTLSDSSEWTLKSHDNPQRFIHIFPARYSPHSFRIKSNTLKSAVLYNIIIGKDYITGEDLNYVRTLLGLSPIKDPVDSEAISEMIEILREPGSVQ